MIYMILAALIINCSHVYLLWSQRNERKWSLSAHAAHNGRSHALYFASHLLGGVFFLLFAKRLYLGTFHNRWLFVVAVITVVFEISQAVVPSKGRTDALHGKLAYAMWSCFLILGYLSLVFVPFSMILKIAVLPFLVTPLALGLYAHRHREKMYWLQMVIISMFCGGMVILSTSIG